MASGDGREAISAWRKPVWPVIAPIIGSNLAASSFSFDPREKENGNEMGADYDDDE